MMMRYVNAVLVLLLVLFAAVQYNDPDGPIWALIYLVPAAWAALAALQPQRLRRPPARIGLLACLAAAVAATLYVWPQQPGWWRKEVWWNSEPAREGMGMMIVTVALLIVAATAWTGSAVRPPRQG